MRAGGSRMGICGCGPIERGVQGGLGDGSQRTTDNAFYCKFAVQ